MLEATFFYYQPYIGVKGELVATIKDSDELAKQHIIGCIENDRYSQKALYKHFYSFAMGICLRYASNKQDALGILNYGFLKIFTNLSKYDSDKLFTAWIGRIITNTAIDFYRTNLKFTNHVELDGYDTESTHTGVYEKLAYNDLLELIQNLSPAYRTVFNLFAIDGFTHEEIAELLNISIGASKSNLFKARKKLQHMLKDMEGIPNNDEIEGAKILNVKLNIKFQ